LKKKATKKDIEIVVSNLIRHLQGIEQKLDALDNIFGTYIKYKKDEKGFQKYIKKQIDLESNDRDK
jgi:predicted transcriptional regulator